jgi:hypothetical protein
VKTELMGDIDFVGPLINKSNRNILLKCRAKNEGAIIGGEPAEKKGFFVHPAFD